MNRNVKIISISGDPLSGKSTVINNMIEKFKKKGINEENIHLVSTGQLFRVYFNKVMKLLENIDIESNNNEIVLKFSKDEAIKRIFKNRDYRNKIEETYELLTKIGFDFNNYDIAAANKMEELSKLRDIVDDMIDSGITDLGKKVLEDNNENEVWLIDSRLAFHNIPDSFKVRLTVNDDVAAKRLLNDKTRGEEDNNYKDLSDAKYKVLNRKKSEQTRYKEKYGVDLSDENNYNLIIDTSYSDVREIADTIIKCEEYDRNEKFYGNKWASPKVFIPMQNIRDTLGHGFGSGLNLIEMADKIEKEGYYPSEEIDVFKFEDKLCIYEGHHRNFACAHLGKTLIPYYVINHLNEDNIKARFRSIRLVDLYDHEDIFHEKNPDGTKKPFYYINVYPDIYDEVRDINEGR